MRLSIGSIDGEMMSQNDRAKITTHKYTNQVLKKVNAYDKDVLFASIKKDKGKNRNGGTYGNLNSTVY